MRPSEWLQSRGWRKIHPDRAEHLSDWRDPQGGECCSFVGARRIQNAREGSMNIEMVGVVEHNEGEPVRLTTECGDVVISALNEGGYNSTQVSLSGVLDWLANNAQSNERVAAIWNKYARAAKKKPRR